jgi:hypothetical protein
LLFDPTMHVGTACNFAFELFLTVGELNLSFAEDEVADTVDVRVEKL